MFLSNCSSPEAFYRFACDVLVREAAGATTTVVDGAEDGALGEVLATALERPGLVAVELVEGTHLAVHAVPLANPPEEAGIIFRNDPRILIASPGYPDGLYLNDDGEEA